MAQKLAGLYIKLSADSADMKKDLAAIKRDFRALGRRADRESNRIKYAFNKIRRAAQVVASAFIFTAGIRQLGKIVTSMAAAEDGVKLLEARFKQFARAGDSFASVYKLSKDLGVSLQSTADSMTRLLVATKEMGTAQSVLEDVHRNIVILGRAGGTSGEEMKGAMRQLSQGLASGRLQGEELRSVLENLPLVAMEIAKQMGIGIGQIRKAAAEGKITGDVVIDALSEIEIKMEDLPTTWAMQTENLRTEWDLFLADLSKAVDEAGLLSALVEAVKFVRVDLMGGFAGITEGTLRSQQADVMDQLAKVKDKLDEYGFDPSTMVLPTQPVFQGAAQGGGIASSLAALSDSKLAKAMQRNDPGLRELVDLYNKLRERLKEYDDELERRTKLEELAKQAAAAKSQLATAQKISKEEEKRLRKLKSAAERINEITRTSAESFIHDMKAARELLAEGLITQETFDRYREHLLEEFDLIKEGSKKTFDAMAAFAEQAAKNIQDAFADFFFDPFDEGLKGMVEGFLTAIRRMLANQLALQFFEMTGLGKLFPTKGGNAFGGFAQAGQAGLVGERGPELFIPSTNGMVVPSLGGVVNNYHFEAGADVATIQAEIIPMLEATKNASVAEVQQRRMEGRL